MGFLTALTAAPRHTRTAARSVGVFMLVGGGFLALFSLGFGEGFTGEKPLLMTAVVLTLLALGARAYFAPRTVTRFELVTYAPMVASFISFRNYTTQDASAGAQVFLLWPLIYAALFLNGAQTVATLLITVIANAFSVAHIPSARSWAVDGASIGIAFAMTAVVVHLLRRRNAAMMAEMERHANEDQLTGLPNRRACSRLLERAFAESGPGQRPLGLLTLDIDNFKSVNDTLGHEGGDRILVEVAKALRVSVRRSDTVARLGGDEFVVVMPDCDPGDAEAVAESIRDRVHRETQTVTVSIGVAHAADLPDVDALLRASDHALYRAKNAGRNTVAV